MSKNIIELDDHRNESQEELNTINIGLLLFSLTELESIVEYLEEKVNYLVYKLKYLEDKIKGL